MLEAPEASLHDLSASRQLQNYIPPPPKKRNRIPVSRFGSLGSATVKTRMFYARKKLAELVNGAEKVRC